MAYMYLLWSVIILSWHRLLASLGLGILLRAETFLFVPLIIVFAFKFQVMLSRSRTTTFYPLFLIYTGVAAIAVVFAPNRGMAFEVFRVLALYYLLAVATTAYVRTPVQAIPILLIFLLQYAWWGIFAGTSGRVPWHPTLSNDDGFGAVVVMGIGLCYWFGLSFRNGLLRWLAFLLAAYCVFGAVASFARGAIFSAIGVAGYIWLRSPRKLHTAAAGVLAVVMFTAASSILFPSGAIWAELQSAFVEGTQEGTGLDRWTLWKAALQVFLERPLVGAGGGNFGVFAMQLFPDGLGTYTNPGWLWGRNVHSAYFQILSEFGIAGSLLFVWLVVDFWKRCRALRSVDRLRTWEIATRGRVDLRYISYGLEAAMLGNLLGGVFYASLYDPWIYTLLALNILLFSVTETPGTLTQTLANHRSPGTDRNIFQTSCGPLSVARTSANRLQT